MSGAARPLRLYIPLTAAQAVERERLAWLTQGIVGGADDPDAHRRLFAGIPDRFTRVETLAEADFALAPYRFGVYRDRMGDLLALADEAQAAGRHVLVFDSADPVPILSHPALILFHPGLEAGYPRVHPAYAQPSNFGDLVERYLDGVMTPRAKGETPVIGFVGFARTSPLKNIAWRWRSLRSQIAYRMGSARTLPTPQTPPVVLRGRLLRQLARDPRVRANFILRDRYRAGARDEQEKKAGQERLEFIHNLRDSDYVFCVRGVGNYSQRFYETLCMGRIPVFINTNCILPFADQIDWRRHVVWVEQADVGRLGTILADFHARLTDEEFAAMQRANRDLWQTWLSRAGFYDKLHVYLQAHMPR